MDYNRGLSRTLSSGENPLAEFIVGNALRRLARERGFLRALLWRVDFMLIWLLIKFFTLIPTDTASRLGDRVGRWVGPRLQRKTEIYRENLAIAFPDLSDAALDQLVIQSWGRVGRILAEYPHLDTILAEEDRLVIDIRHPLSACQEPAQPCVFVSAHQSNWEVVCSAMAKLGIPNASVYSPPSNPLLDRMLLDSRRALNCELVPRDNAPRPLMNALRRGRTVGLVMDRRVDEGQPIRFFGRDKPSTILPAKLALKFNCDLVPAQVVRLQDARYKIIFYPPVVPRNPQADETSQAIDMIQQVHEQFEQWIREHPADWFCSKRMWPKDPTATTQESGSDKDIDSYAA